MDKVIIFLQENGCVAVIYPAICGLTVEEIARKDTPIGKPFLIIPADQFPTDHTFFNAFEADFSNPDGYGIGHDAWFAERAM